MIVKLMVLFTLDPLEKTADPNKQIKISLIHANSPYLA